MRFKFSPLHACACVLLLVSSLAIWIVAVQACALLHSWSELPSKLQASLDQLPEKIVPLVTKPVLAEVDRQAIGIRKDTLSVITGIRDTADKRLGNALARYDATLQLLDSRSEQALQTAAGLREDLKPAIDNAAELEAHADKTVVDLRPQLLGLTAASKVAMGETAQTMKTVRDTVPQLAGIAADFHDATHSLDAKYFHPPPRTEKQKIGDFFKYLGTILIAALRGGAI